MPFLGEISALTAAIIWSFSSFLFTSAAKKIGVMQLNINRMLFASVLLIMVILILGINISLYSQQILFLSISGFFGLTFGDTFLFKAYKEVGPRISSLLMSINPAIAAFLGWIIAGETLDLLSIIGITITLSGVTIVLLEKPKADGKFKINTIGVVSGVLGAFGQAIGLVFAKMANNIGEIHFITATFYRLTIATLLLIPIGYLIKQYKNPLEIYKKDSKIFGIILLGSFLGPFLGITLSYIAVINTKIGIASTLLSILPVTMLPLSAIIYKEKLSFTAIAGAIIAVGGIALLFLH
jgi:drug/metabolite transporter (DMT)-like permease